MDKKKGVKTWGGARAGSGSKKRLESTGSRFALRSLAPVGETEAGRRVTRFTVIDRRHGTAVVRCEDTGETFLLERDN